MNKQSPLVQTVLINGGILIMLRVFVEVLFITFQGEEILFDRSKIEMPLVEMGLAIAMMIYAGYKFRDTNGYTITLQEGFLIMVGVYALGSLGAALFQILWVYFLNPATQALVPTPDWYSPTNFMNSFFTSVLFGSVLALVFSLILSRRKAKIS
ncbi:MAG: hypothetical protein AAFY71_07330 [Bacteroidota bacterium]